MNTIARYALTAGIVAGSLLLAGTPVSAQGAAEVAPPPAAGAPAQATAPAAPAPRLSFAQRKARILRLEQQRVAILQEHMTCVQAAGRPQDLTSCNQRRREQNQALRDQALKERAQRQQMRSQ